jgi:hypothetical protein
MIVWDESAPECKVNVPPAGNSSKIVVILKIHASALYTVCAPLMDLSHLATITLPYPHT